jgi:bifunctional DNA primase/polymerase-like protein
MIDRKIRAAAAYIARGWKVFTVSGGKRPWNNCKGCAAEQHSPEECICLDCHSFYAASGSIERVRASLWLHGQETMLAVRTGAASGIVAIDGEGDDKDGYGQTGLEILDSWEDWCPGGELADTLRSGTSGGGVHLLYQYPAGTGVVVGSRNRVLPNVDIKADGGYVVVPPGGGRNWLNWGEWSDRLAVPGDALLAFMTSASGGNGQASAGGKSAGALSLRTADVIPAGSRYEFTRDLVYHLRKQGYAWDKAVEICKGYWERYEQPPAGMRIGAGGVWYLPFTQMMYELERVWRRVEPEAPLAANLADWAVRQSDK